jgi:hypothetical protein
MSGFAQLLQEVAVLWLVKCESSLDHDGLCDFIVGAPVSCCSQDGQDFGSQLPMVQRSNPNSRDNWLDTRWNKINAEKV